MTERKLWNGWNNPKVVCACVIVYFLLGAFLWIKEVEFFDACNDVYVKTEAGIYIDEEYPGPPVWENLTELLQASNSMTGIVFALIVMISVAVVVIQKESFRQNWDLTLRRIPHYRGRYLCSKVVAVLVPAVGFSVYYGTQWFQRFTMYEGEVQRLIDSYIESQEAYKIKYVPLEKEEFFRVIPMKPILEMTLYSILTALLLLLLNLAARRIKKDLAGFCAAIAGLVAVVLLFFEVVPMERAVELVLLFGGIGLIAFFTVRHVYVKL